MDGRRRLMVVLWVVVIVGLSLAVAQRFLDGQGWTASNILAAVGVVVMLLGVAQVWRERNQPDDISKIDNDVR